MKRKIESCFNKKRGEETVNEQKMKESYFEKKNENCVKKNKE